MTRVLPLPAPARISTGPSTVTAASSCWGFRSFVRSIVVAIFRSLPLSSESGSFHCNAFRQIPGLVDIATPADGAMIGEQLQRNDFENRQQKLVCRRHRNDVLRALRQIGVPFIAYGDDNAVPRFDLFDVVQNLLVPLMRI